MKGRGHRESIIKRNEPCAVIASGGMLKGMSSSLEWAKGIIEKEECGIFLNGWADPCSPAHKLLELMKLEDDGREKELALEDAEGKAVRFPVKCELDFFNLSGHAHGSQLENYVEEMNPEHLIFIHTEGERTKKYLKRRRSRIAADHVHLPGNGALIEF